MSGQISQEGGDSHVGLLISGKLIRWQDKLLRLPNASISRQQSVKEPFQLHYEYSRYVFRLRIALREIKESHSPHEKDE